MNESIYLPILPLVSKLTNCLSQEVGIIISKSNQLVQHVNANVREENQARINNTIQGLLLVYLFALWEEYIDRDIERRWLSEQERNRLNAFRHIRHSAAHGFDGTRANKCRIEFETIMNSSEPFPNVIWNSNRINLANSQVVIDCQRFMISLVPDLIARIAGNGAA